MLDQNEFDKIVKILANKRRCICTIGGNGSHFFAELLAARLYQIRPNARAIGPYGPGFSPEERLAFFGRRDVVLAIDFRRYQKSTISFVRIATSKGATIILVTDTWFSPISDFTSHVVTIYSDSGWPYDI